ncbi:PI-actitoxin-Afv2a-like [Condylostylus longicornis]|uniref:PI-actitoxin-Afv2a-like n=1 Tax=Condylostylus longicornis TaxID=2530218 RepID=UPI00244DDBED|nr:PI-actitoxin-Afv2a-like [Condylostylus longicornis]
MKLILALFLIIFISFAYADIPTRCLLPFTSGFGRAGIPKVYFNSASRECEDFIWGGLERGSNDNRFDTIEECESFCK